MDLPAPQFRQSFASLLSVICFIIIIIIFFLSLASDGSSVHAACARKGNCDFPRAYPIRLRQLTFT